MRYISEPRQSSIFDINFKYIIDACSVFSQNVGASYPRTVYKGLWDEIDGLARTRELVICRQIANEILSGKKDDLAKEWLRNSGILIIDEDRLVQKKVERVVNTAPQLLRFGTIRKSSSGDAFLIATAMDYHLTIITEENKRSPVKIPQVAQKLGVDSMSISELAESRGWSFERVIAKD